MLCISEKTVYRRLEENGLSICDTYANLANQELDDIIKEVLHQLPNSGYKTMRSHLLSRGYKVQENRIRESMRTKLGNFKLQSNEKIIILINIIRLLGTQQFF